MLHGVQSAGYNGLQSAGYNGLQSAGYKLNTLYQAQQQSCSLPRNKGTQEQPVSELNVANFDAQLLNALQHRHQHSQPGADAKLRMRMYLKFHSRPDACRRGDVSDLIPHTLKAPVSCSIPACQKLPCAHDLKVSHIRVQAYCGLKKSGQHLL